MSIASPPLEVCRPHTFRLILEFSPYLLLGVAAPRLPGRSLLKVLIDFLSFLIAESGVRPYTDRPRLLGHLPRLISDGYEPVLSTIRDPRSFTFSAMPLRAFLAPWLRSPLEEFSPRAPPPYLRGTRSPIPTVGGLPPPDPQDDPYKMY